jgi:predicted nucleic acid-binding Zn ribbon protein
MREPIQINAELTAFKESGYYIRDQRKKRKLIGVRGVNKIEWINLAAIF